MTENEKTELFDKWYDENYDEWAEGEEGIALREELEQAFKSGVEELENKIADIKANCDYVLEGRENEYREERSKLIDDFENMKAGLESQIATLGERCNQLLKDKGELTDKIEKMKCCGNCAKNGHICVAEEMQGKLCGKNKDKWELRR